MGRQRYGTTYYGTACFYGLYDLLCRFIDEVVIVRFQFDSNFFGSYWLFLFYFYNKSTRPCTSVSTCFAIWVLTSA